MTRYLKRNWKISSAVCFFQIIQWGLQAVQQLFLMKSFDRAMKFDFRGFIFWTAVDLTSWVVYFGTCFLQSYFQARAVKTLNNQVRHDLYLTLMSKNYREYHDRDTGEYISWLTNNVKQIEKLVWNPFFDCVGRASQVLWSVFVLLTPHWSLMAASIVSAVVMWALPKLFEKRMEKLGRDCTEAEAAAVSRLKDLLSGFDVLRFFGKSKSFLVRGDDVSDKIEEPGRRLKYIQDGFGCSMGMVSVAIQVMSSFLIMVLAYIGAIQPAVLAGGTNLFAGVSNGLSRFSELRLSLAAGKPYFDNITVHTGEEKAETGGIMPKVKNSVKLCKVGFGYDEKNVIKDVNMEFETGKKYALTGPSGCGKSTLLKVLLGWLPEYSGKIFLDGEDARKYTAEQLQSQMGYIAQNVFVFNTTIRENITLGGDFSDSEIEKAVRESALADDIAAMPDGLDTEAGEEGSRLSGGQKQRIAIARALIHKRSILLVDEGTSALDRRNADIIEQSLLANKDLTLILVSHHLTDERRAQFDRVYELEAAKTMVL